MREASKPSPAEDGDAEIGKDPYDGDEHRPGCGHPVHQAWTISLHMNWPSLGTLDLQRPRSNGRTRPLSGHSPTAAQTAQLGDGVDAPRRHLCAKVTVSNCHRRRRLWSRLTQSVW